MTCFKLKSLVKKNFTTTILFINFLPTAQSLSLYAQLIQEITTSTSLSMQILQVWASSIRRFSFCNHRGCCTFGDLPIYRHLKSSSYTLEVLGLLKRRHLGWETENISGILHKYCVSLWIFLSFWNQWDPMQLPKSIWAKKSAVFSYLGSHMWDNTKIQKNEKYWPKMKMKNFPFFGQKSIIHS